MNLFDLLKEYAGMSREEAEHYFSIENTAEEWTMKSILYLEPTKFHAVLALAKEYGGTYDPKSKGSVIHIPKESVPKPVINEQGIHSEGSKENEKLEEALGHTPPSKSTLSKAEEEDVAISQKEIQEGKAKSFKTADEVIADLKKPIETTEEYALSRSLKGKLGQLVPCLEDAEGRIFDGVHRKAIDPKAWTVKLDKVKTPVDRALARMTVNFCRRHYTSEEMKNDIGLLIGSGLTMEQIVESTGISESTIYKYKPQELKNQVRVEAGKEAHRISQDIAPSSEVTVKTQDTVQPNIAVRDTPQFIASAQGYIATELKSCEKCGQPVHRSKMGLVAGKLVCPTCAGIGEPVKPPTIEKELKPRDFDSYAQKRAGMQVQHSKLEMDLLTELSTRGVTPQRDYSICLWATDPDGTYPEKKLAYYVHGEPHDKGKALERDDEIKAALERAGWSVLVFRHGEGSVKEWADQVQEALKW